MLESSTEWAVPVEVVDTPGFSGQVWASVGLVPLLWCIYSQGLDIR